MTFLEIFYHMLWVIRSLNVTQFLWYNASSPSLKEQELQGAGQEIRGHCGVLRFEPDGNEIGRVANGTVWQSEEITAFTRWRGKPSSRSRPSKEEAYGPCRASVFSAISSLRFALFWGS